MVYFTIYRYIVNIRWNKNIYVFLPIWLALRTVPAPEEGKLPCLYKTVELLEKIGIFILAGIIGYFLEVGIG
jgi:hypothetical protein